MNDWVPAKPLISRHARARLYRDAGPSDRLVGRTTMRQVLEDIEASGLSAPALTWYDNDIRSLHFDYQALVQQVRRSACWLAHEHEVRAGDRVIVISSNSPEAFIAHLALMFLGAITVPVSNTESERVLNLIVAQVAAKSLLHGRGVQTNLLAVQGVTAVSLPTLPLQEPSNQVLLPKALAEVHPDDPAVILFTSGTTSAPKGVCLSHYNLLVNAEGLARVHNLAALGTHMCILPLFHANAFGFSLVGSFYSGSHVVLCSGLPGYSVWSILRTERVHILSLVPEIIRVLAKIAVPRETLPDLKYVVSAAAPLPKAVAEQFTASTGIAIHQGYGLSECVNFAATVPWNITDQNLRRAVADWPVPSIGPELFGCSVAIRRTDGTVAATNEEGEIVVSGHTVMLGYWGADEATEAALGDGYLRTGDLGFFALVDGTPYFFVTGRKKEIVLRYGENISPRVVEAELEELAAIGRFAVVGFANEAAGEEIGLYLVAARTPGNEKAVMEIVRKCSIRYRPRVVVFSADPLPATATGKIKRALLAKRFQNYVRRSFGGDPIIGTGA
jgi:long-chain acyl-CoA synthetase